MKFYLNLWLCPFNKYCRVATKRNTELAKNRHLLMKVRLISLVEDRIIHNFSAFIIFF
jgi:hypothetical protein